MIEITNFTQTSMSPPNNNSGGVICAGFADDEVSEIGDRIANLTLLEAKELSEYLTEIHGIALAF